MNFALPARYGFPFSLASTKIYLALKNKTPALCRGFLDFAVTLFKLKYRRPYNGRYTYPAHYFAKALLLGSTSIVLLFH